MKKIDKLLLKSFAGPFVATFVIALFVLTMQTLWVYIDDIMGKGAGLLLILELISYLVVSLFPLALPLGVLISAVMVFGALAEKYELAAFKSAGVPLIRILMPLAFVASGIGVFSFICSNYLIPITNLQFKSRLYDIRKQKPTLSLNEGIFNDDFVGYTIYIGSKSEDGRSIKDIIIYDNKNSSSQGLSQLTAASGEMYMTKDNKYFIMNLYDGVRNQESNRSFKKNEKTYPFVRTRFKQHELIFDLSQFDINETDKDLFKSHQQMMSVDQLMVAIDSLGVKIEDKFNNLHKNMYQNFNYEKKRDTVLFKPRGVKTKKKNLTNTKKQSPKEIIKKEKQAARMDSIRANVRQRAPKSLKLKKIMQLESLAIDTVSSFVQTFAKGDRPQMFNRAKTTARSILSNAGSAHRSLEILKEKKVKHIFIMHTKITYAIICIVFLFIGGSMGAIVRKGGFGYPLLVAVAFFVIFIVLTLACEKLAESHVVSAVLAAWIPILVLAPLSAMITSKAMGESTQLNLPFVEKITALFNKLK